MDAALIERVIQATGLSRAEFASQIEADPGFVYQWVTGRRRVSPKYARAIEARFGVSRHLLRPDVFGPAPDKEAA